MGLISKARQIGRRNFLKAAGGVSALAAFGTAAVWRGPRPGGPVRTGLIGYGKQGKLLQGCIDPEVMKLVAIADIKPRPIAAPGVASDAAWYQDWRRMLQQEGLEAVIVATPLWIHAEITIACLEARKHVLCEPAMARDMAGCKQMLEASKRNNRLLAIGYQDFYQPVYWAAYRNIIEQGLLGDIYSVEAAWHSYASGRLAAESDVLSFDPRPWGYASSEELLNWRLFRRYSGGMIAENGSRLISLTNWFLNAAPSAIQSTGGLYSYKDGRDVDDHVYATLEYPNGKTATMSLIQSNGLESSYVQIMGTKGTLVIGRDEAMLFSEQGSNPTKVQTAKVGGARTVMDASASRSEEASDHSTLTGGVSPQAGGEMVAYQQEISAFCGSIRSGAPMRHSAVGAFEVAKICFAIDDAKAQGKRMILQDTISADRSAAFSAAEKRERYA